MPVKPCFMHTVNEKMSKLAKSNAKCEIFARYAEIKIAQTALINNQFLACFTTGAKIKYEILWNKVHFISSNRIRN